MKESEKKESSFKERQTAEVREMQPAMLRWNKTKTLKTEGKERRSHHHHLFVSLSWTTTTATNRERWSRTCWEWGCSGSSLSVVNDRNVCQFCLQTDKKGEDGGMEDKNSRLKWESEKERRHQLASTQPPVSTQFHFLFSLHDLHYVISFLFLTRSHTNYLSSTVQQPGFRADCEDLYAVVSPGMGWRYLKCSEPIALYLLLCACSS